MSSRNRKYDSGFEKHKKKRRLEAADQSQTGSMDRFVVKDSQLNSKNQTPEANRVGEIESHGDQGQGDANIAVQHEAQVEEIG